MKKLFIVLFIILCVNSIFAQNVGINSDGSAPDGSAMLDIKATDAGLLIPRVELTGAVDVGTITSPANSLLVYNNGISWGDEGYYYNAGNAITPDWTKLSSSEINGGGATNHVAYWSDANTLTYDQDQFYWDATNNRLGIGTNAPAEMLHVMGDALIESGSYYGYVRIEGTGGGAIYLSDDGVGNEGQLITSLNGNEDFCIYATQATGNLRLGAGGDNDYVYIKTNGNIDIGASAPDDCSILELTATNKGLLIPRVVLTGTSDITTITGAETTSLLVYNTATGGGVTPGFYYWNGSAWTTLGSAGTIGGSGTTNYVARWTPDGNTLGIGKIQDNGSTVGINTAPNANFMLYNNGNFNNAGFFYTTLNTSAVPLLATSGLAVSWNSSGGQAEVDFWNMFNNAVTSYNFHQKTGAATEKEIMKITGGGNIQTSGNIVQIGAIDATGTDKNTYVSFFSETDGSESGRIWRTPGDNGIFHLYNWGTGSMNFSTNVTERMRITGNGEVGINTTNPGSYQTKIYAADGNSGLAVYKSQDLAGSTQYGILTEAYNGNGAPTETTALKAIAGTNGGDTYGVRGITEHAGSGYFYSVSGEAYNWNQSILNAEGYLGYFEGNAGTKGYRGFIGVLGHVNDNNGYSNVYPSYGGYFDNQMNSNDNTQDKYGVYAEVDAQSFTGGDGSKTYGIYAIAQNAETNYAGYFDGNTDAYGVYAIRALDNTVNTQGDVAVAPYPQVSSTIYAFAETDNDANTREYVAGVYGLAEDLSGGDDIAIGVVGRADGTAECNYGLVGFVGDHEITKEQDNGPLMAYGNAGLIVYNRSDNAPSNFSWGGRIVLENDGTALNKYGLQVDNPSDGSTKYGIETSVTGTGTANYGVYASASGATTNYAGYFEGDVEVDNGNINVNQNAFCITLTAGEDLTAGDVVKVSTTTDLQVEQTNATGDENIIGVVIADANSGDPVIIAIGGAVQVRIDGGVTRGDFLEASGTTDGRAISTGTTGGAGDFGIALETGTDGNLIWMVYKKTEVY